MTIAISCQQRRPFNTPLETGMRSLFVLDAIAPQCRDLQRLIYYDYFLLHSGDVPEGPASLHPPVPHRSGELLVRRSLLSDGLDLMYSKELLVKEFGVEGIRYGASDLTRMFLSHFTSGYANALRSVARWVAATFESQTDEDLANFVTIHLGRWGAEFKLESVVRGVPQ
jgi:hypothetical protein